MSESLTKLHYEIDDSTTLQMAHLVDRHLKKTLPASQPFICQKFRENLKTLRVAVQSKLAGSTASPTEVLLHQDWVLERTFLITANVERWFKSLLGDK